MTATELSSEMRECIDRCLDCHKTCTETASHVLHEGGKHSEADHLVALLDCAQLCLTHADFMTRRSPHHSGLAETCANVCQTCADMCDAHADKDGMMKRCADTCRQCEQSCRRMAMAATSGQGHASASLPQGAGAAAAPTAASAEGSNREQGKGAGMTQMT